MRVKNFMRELKMKPTKWDENIVALAEKGSMSVDEFLKTDPITFGEKIWGKHDWKYTSGYSRLERILGESTHREMWGYYVRTPAQLAARAYEDAKVAAIKEQKALGLATYMGVSAQDKTGWEYVFAENKAEKAAAEVKAAAAQLAAVNEAEKAAGGVCQDGWHAAALEHANALFKRKEADTALAALRQKAAAAAAAEKEWDERYYAEKRTAKGPSVTVEDMKRIMGDRTNMTAKEVVEIFAKERNELLAKTEEDEEHEMWMIERMCGATSLPCEESAPAPSIHTSASSQVEVDEYLPEDQTQLVAGVKEELLADVELVPLPPTDVEGLRQWSNTSIYRTLKTDTEKEAIEKFEAFFMKSKSHKWGTPLEVARMKVRLIDLLLKNFKDSHPSLLSFMYDRSPEDQQASLERGIQHFEAWKRLAEKELRELEAKRPFDFAFFAEASQSDDAVGVDEDDESDVSDVTDTQVSSCWACPTCTAVWRTGS
jgi:hypothetical protein